MEWYTLDSQFRKDQVIEGFETFIWTERYSAYGDFEIKIGSSPRVKSLLQSGTWITKDGSTYVMKVETITEAYDTNNALMLDIVGRSLEAILLDRVAMPAIADLTTTPQWILTATPGNIMRTMFTTICPSATLNAGDTIPFYTSGTLLPAGNIAEPSTSVTINLDPATLYDSLVKIAALYSLGFRFVRNGENSEIYFEVYTGNDLTTGQTTLPAVIFSEAFDNLSGASHLSSTSTVKNVAYVFAPNGAATVYGPFTDPSVSGLNRRVLFVNANDITLAAGPALNFALQQRGMQELTKYGVVYQFDGDVSQHSQLVYGVDYKLGDICEEQDTSGYGSRVMVTEQIFVSDNKGERSYPTLSVVIEIVPGTWSEWTGATYWADVDGAVTWGSL